MRVKITTVWPLLNAPAVKTEQFGKCPQLTGQKCGPKMQHTQILGPHVRPFPSSLVLEESVQTARIALCSAPTINWDNKFNRTSELDDMGETERTFRQSAINSSNMEGKPKWPKQMERSISPLFFILVVRLNPGRNWFQQLQVFCFFF